MCVLSGLDRCLGIDQPVPVDTVCLRIKQVRSDCRINEKLGLAMGSVNKKSGR